VAALSPGLRTLCRCPNKLIYKKFTPTLPYEIAVALPKHRTRAKLIDDFVKHLVTNLRAHATSMKPDGA
jgi:hypothetical protein